MRRIFGIFAAALTLVTTAMPAAAQVDAPPGLELQRVIVELDPKGSAPRGIANDVVARFGGNGGFLLEHALKGFVAELPQAAIDALWRNPNVVSITRDRIVVSVAAQEASTGYDRAEADLAPPPTTTTTACPVDETCTDVDVAVLDTGTNAVADLNVVERTDCSSIILPGFGSCRNGVGIDGHGHGTYTAGIVAAFDNDIGTVGVAPGARLHSVKVLGDDGTGYLGSILAGVDWVTARADTIEVVNMSLAGEFTDATLDAAIANSVAAGVTYVVAAGNSDADAATFSPSNHPDVITVSAMADADGGGGGLSGFSCRDGEVDETLASFSNFGEVVDIAAPGVCIASSSKDGGTTTASGTSAAAPFVAGAAARYIAGQTSPPGPAAVRAALLGDAHPQGTACGFTGDKDAFAEPLLFVNGSAFGGDGTCSIAAVDPTPPTAPVNLTAAALGYPVSLTWAAASDAESGILEYRVYRNTVPATGEVMIGSVRGGATSYVDEDTDPGATYAYQVTAVNLQFGESARSNSAQATSAPDDPSDAGWWALDDGAGTMAADETAWNRPGTLANGPLWTAGRIDGGLDLDGSDDRIDLDPTVVDGFGDVSVSMWLKTTKTGTQTLLSGANPDNVNEFLLQAYDHTTLRFYVGYTTTAGVQWSMDSIADGLWHHLALVRNDTLDRVSAYRDGISLGTYGLTVPMDVLDVDALVVGQDQDSVGGGFQSAEALDGTIDDVRTFTRLLTQDEVDGLSMRDLTAPSGPTSLTAVSNGPAIDLGWSPAVDAESGIDHYEVWRGSGIGIDAPKALLAAVAGDRTSYRDIAVQFETPYAYEVVAVNGGGVGGASTPEANVTSGAADADLAGWWALDDGSGTAALDWSAYARHGTLGGDPAWTPGITGGALDFDGTGDLVDLDSAILDGVDDMTVSLWFRTSKDGVQAMLSGANASNDAEVELVPISATNIRFYTGESNVSFLAWTVPSISTGSWHHLAVTRDDVNDRVTLYLDGVSYGSQVATLTPLDIDSGGLLLGQEQDTVGGGFDTSQSFVGTMDEVRLYERVLSASEITDLAGLGEPVLDTSPPAPPVGLAAAAGDGEVSLEWVDNDEPDLASYTVYRSATAGGPYIKLAAGVTTSDHLDTTAVNGVSSFYVVTASDTSGNESVVSGEVSATPTDTTAPAAPTGLVAGAGDARVNLDWDDNPGPDIAGYTVYRSETSGGPYDSIVAGLTSSDHVDSSAVNGTTYFYVVTATDSAGNDSADSLEVSATPADTTPPAAPTGLLATAGDGEVALDWADNAELNLSGYSVYRSTTSGGPYSALADGLTDSTYLDAAVVNGTAYFYVVTASDAAGNESSDSNEASATPADTTPPAAPTGLTAAPGEGQVSLDWADNDETDLTSYTVYRSETSGGPYAEVAVGVGPSGYLDTTVVNGTAYFYVVTAADSAGNESAGSEEAGATPIDVTAPAAPAGLSAIAGDGAVSLDWHDNGEPDLMSYSVYRSTAGAPFVLLSSGLADSAYADTAVVNDTTYAYVVTAIDAAGNESDDSKTAMVTPQDLTPPAAPTGLTATAGDGQVSLDWDDNAESDLSSYTVLRATTAGGPYSAVASGLVTSDHGDTDVVNGTTYFYVVTAVDGDGNTSEESNQAPATPQAPAPAYVDVVVGDGAFAYWRLGESAGDTAVDVVGGHSATYENGVILGEPGLLATGFDTAARFDGVDDVIAVGDSRDINTGGPYAARTIELWFNADDVSRRQILYEEGGTTRGMSIYLDGGMVYLGVWNRKNDDGGGPWGPVWVSTPVAAGTTHHVVLVFDGATGRLEAHLDGAMVGTVFGVRDLHRHRANIGIGGLNQQTYFHDGLERGNAGHPFGGVIDEVALYPTPLSATQIATHWWAGTAD
jgi:fibronectin type 3 domain-containing protein